MKEGIKSAENFYIMQIEHVFSRTRAFLGRYLLPDGCEIITEFFKEWPNLRLNKIKTDSKSQKLTCSW